MHCEKSPLKNHKISAVSSDKFDRKHEYRQVSLLFRNSIFGNYSFTGTKGLRGDPGIGGVDGFPGYRGQDGLKGYEGPIGQIVRPIFIFTYCFRELLVGYMFSRQ